jgi:hypothetical protein
MRVLCTDVFLAKDRGILFRRYGEFTTGGDTRFICWSALLTNYARPNAEATIFSEGTSAPKTDCPDVFAQFLKLESQSPAELRAALWPGITRHAPSSGTTPPYDYRPLRERPILRSADGRMILIDPVFAAEKCAIGPLFHVLLRPTPTALQVVLTGDAIEVRASALDVIDVGQTS